MSEIGKEFGWTGPGKYVTREGKVFSVVATGDSERAFVGFLQNGSASSHKSPKEADELAGAKRIACFYVEETTPPEGGE